MGSRADDGHDLSYPTAPDARGSTRVNYRRRPYYLGPHDSPLSHVMFGLWKHQLLETGDPPATRDLRPMVEELLGKVAAEGTTYSAKPERLGYYLAAVGFTLAALLSLKIWFSDPPSSVDGKPLSESEVAVVRSVRETELEILQRTNDAKASLASVTEQLMRRGSDDGARHESVQGR